LTLARDADLLVHDSTFTDELIIEARSRGHSTARQAAETAVAAKARRLLLIHVSARYHDPRPLLEEAAAVFDDVAVAHDLMEVQV
jgi:ribonuclease Z